MRRARFLATMLLVALCTTYPALGAKLSSEIEKRGVVMWEDTEFSQAAHVLDYETLKQKILSVQDKPCEMYFGRTVLKNPSTGFIGVITGALGVRVAMDHDVTPEEGGMNKAFFIKPADPDDWKRWIGYFKGEIDTNGSRDLATALVLRRKARIQKFQMFLEDKTGKSIEEITEADLGSVRNDINYKWLSNDIFEPATVILKPELAKVLWKNRMDTGPAFGPLPSLNLVTPEEVGGRQKTVKGCVVDSQGRFVVRRTDSVVLLSDLGDMFKIDDAIGRDSLGDVVGHELFHGIMADIYGVDSPGGPKSKSRMGHDAHVISDYSMGLSEGWAEFFEAWSGEDNEAFDNRGGKAKVTRFLLGRQVPIRRGLYTQADFEKYRRTKKTGRIKNGSQMEATEGLVAGILYAILTHDEISDPFELIIEAMYRDKPQTQTELVTAMMNRAASDREKRIIGLTFLYATKFATVSPEAWRLYQEMYTAKLAFVRGKNDGADEAESAALRQAFSQARAEYKEFVSGLEGQVLSGSLPLNANVGPELWMDGVLKKTVDGKEKEITYRFNLNTVTAGFLSAIGLGDQMAIAVVRARDAKGFCESEQDLRGVVPADAIELLTMMRKLYAQGLADQH